MRILHIDTGTVLRGGQEFLLLLARGLRQRGHQQTIACPAGSALEETARADGYHVLTTPAGDRHYLSTVRTIRRFLRQNPCDIVHAHDARGQTVAWLSTLGRREKRIAARLVVFQPRNLFLHRWKYTHTCDRVIALSPAVKETMVRNGVPEGRVEVVMGGIYFPEELPGPEARLRMRAAWGLAEDEFVISHLAAFTSEKGQGEALEALLILLPGHPKIRMILAGEGPLRHDPAMQARLEQTRGAAQLPGYVKPTPDFYAGCDLFLLNSSSEALGLSVLYAMAYGLPVIASRVGGLPDVVTDGVTGWLIPPGDPRALAAAIAEAASDPARLRRFGDQARERARTFSSAVTAERTEAVYHQVLREK
jgi:glycosyltransferase involved in cell wall biosynthesis